MESLSETDWDVVISGTGLQQSLLALALSRSEKKVLHVDDNDYYGGAEAAFSLQEVDEWVTSVSSGPITNASIWKAENDHDLAGDSERLSFSRAYTLALGPQLIYSRSKLIAQLVSSKVYKQLEFQAVGNWWVYSQGGPSSTVGKLERLPNGREDVFSDVGINLREKRSLMKFLKFVVDYENQTELWEPHAESPLNEFLRDSFGLTPLLTTRIIALTLSLDLLPQIRVGYALPRIARHLTSIGIFGPGFGAVIPKWGGASEIAQVACRAGAVGGGVYMLGTGVKHVAATADSNLTLTLTNDEVIRTKAFVRPHDDPLDKDAINQPLVSKMITIVASDFAPLLTVTVEGAPPPAVSVIAFPPSNIDVDGEFQAEPVYIMAHSSETGECPAGQSVLYATTSTSGKSKARLEAAVAALLTSFTSGQGLGESRPEEELHKAQSEEVTASGKDSKPPRILYSVYYEQIIGERGNSHSGKVCFMASPSVELAFDDVTLENVEDAWRLVTGIGATNPASQMDEPASYMAFGAREQMNGQDVDG